MTGSPNGVSRHRPFDRWFRYPAGFSPETLDVAIDAVASSPNGLLIDPFAGSGSAGTYVVQHKMRYAGIEAHPLIAELAALKFRRPGDPKELMQCAEELIAKAQPAAIEAEPSLILRSFSPGTLAVLLGLRNTLQGDCRGPWHTHMKWALLATLRDVACVKVGWPYQRPAQTRTAPYANPRHRFMERVAMMTQDLESSIRPHGGHVVCGDSRTYVTWQKALPSGLADACVTSPPYLNNFDYADATRLEVYFWKQARTWAELCREVRSDMLVATTQQTRLALAQRATELLEVYPATSDSITKLQSQLQRERLHRPRGKEYDRVLAPYFVGMARILTLMYEYLKPSGMAAWIVGDSAPYGVYVDTPQLILQLGRELGFVEVDDIRLRDRGRRWTTSGHRHGVGLSERLITFARPRLREGRCAPAYSWRRLQA